MSIGTAKKRMPTAVGRTARLCLILQLVAVITSASVCQAGADPGKTIISIDFRDSSVLDVLHAIASVANINIVTDSSIQGNVSVKFKNLTVTNALDVILGPTGHFYRRDGDVFVVSRIPFPEKPVISVDSGGRVTLHARNADVRELLLEVSRQAGLSLVPLPDEQAEVSLELKDVPSSDALQSIASAAGYLCYEKNGVWCVDKEAPASQIADLAKAGTAEHTGSSPDPASDTSAPIPELATGTDNGLPPPGEIGTRTVSLKYLRASEIMEYLDKASLTAMTGTDQASRQLPPPVWRGTKEENVLLVTGTAEGITKIRSEVEQIDIPAPQVTFEAKIVEIYTSKDRDVGALLAKASGGKLSADLVKGQFSYASIAFTKQVDVVLQSLVSEGKAKIIASPSICTLTGHEAIIDIGQVRYYRVTNLPDSQPGGQLPYYYPTTLETVSAGVILKLTPWVGASGEITASIQPEVSSVTGITKEGLPEVNRRKVVTMIRVKDGDTIVIGGLKQQEDSTSTSRVPLLGDLPVLGSLFRTKKVVSRESELMIFITPRIIKSSDRAETVPQSQ